MSATLAPVTVGSLTLRAPVDSPAQRVAAAGWVEHADVRPSAVGPATILVVRRVVDVAAAGPTDRPGPPSSRWEEAVRGRLAALAASADRPARSAVPPDSAAVLFTDMAELVACLLRDHLNRHVAARWWWRHVARVGTTAGVVAVLVAEAEHVPAAVVQLERWGIACAALDTLDSAGVRAVGDAVAAVYDAPGWTVPVRGGPATVETVSAGRPLAGVAGLGERERLVELCRQIRPHDWPTAAAGATAAASEEGTAPVPAEALDHTPDPPAALRPQPESRRHIEPPPRRTEPPDLPDRAAAQPDGERPSRPPPPDGGAGNRSQDRPSAAPQSANVDRPSTLAAEVGEGAARVDPTSSRVVLDDAPSEVGGWASIDPAEDTDELASEAPHRAPIVGHRLDAEPERDGTVTTRYGGIFFLFPVLAEDELDITLEASAGAGPWAVLELVARSLLAGEPGLEDDGVWAVLADLDGRDPGEPIETWPGSSAEIERVAPRIERRLVEATGLPAATVVDHVFTRVADVHVTPMHVDVVFPLVSVSIVVRRSGLDRDPGWLPRHGRVVRFHYEEGR